MIVSNFYPNVTPPGTSYLTQFTDFIDNITIEDPNKIAEAYYMGYIPYNQLPSTYKISKLNISTGGVISFDDVTKQENAPWFYTGRYYTSIYNRYIQGIYKLNTSTGRFESLNLGTTGTKQYGFVNGAEIATLTTQGNFTIHFTCQMSESDGTYIDWWNDINNAWHHFNLTVAQFLGFMAGTYAIHFSFSQYGTSGTFDMYYNDLKDGTYTYTDSVSGRKMRIFITSFSTPDPFVDYDSEGTQRHFSDICAAALLHVNHEDGVLPYIINYNGWHYGYSDANYISVSVSENNVTMSNRLQLYTDYLCGGWSGSVPREFWSNPNGETEVFGNIVAINHHTNLDGRLYRIFTPDDIMKAFVSMFTRLFTEGNTGYGYSTGKYWALFNEDNSPKWNFADGDFNSIVTELRPWQISNITVNTFTPDDIPPYSPGDDTADSGGDNIAPYDFTNTPLSAANNFTTLYALTTAQVAAFGSIMWASLSDPNFWHAVGVEFSNDFSINPADMMRYFNFLRYYPFDLTPYSSQYISGIYIGRSTIPIQFPAGMEYPRRATRNLIQIKGGEVTALLPSPYNSDDFFVSDPATQMQAHIPFCGTVQISAAECYGRTLYLNYVVDLQSGAIQATISVQSDSYYIVATLAGTCGAGVQITANNNIEFLTRIATVATGGISSAATMATRGAQVAGAEGAAAAGVVGALTGTVSALAGLPPVTVHKQGSTTGFANYGGDPRAYITIQAPKRSIPDSYAKSTGYVSNKRARVGDLSGYTEMINPDLSGIAAHEDELAEIYRILQTGFYA